MTSAAVSLASGTIEAVKTPAPLSSLTTIEGSIGGAESGVSATVEGGALVVSASAGALQSKMTLSAHGLGCTATECGRSFSLSVPVTVLPIAAPPGLLETLTQPSPDRVAEASEGELTDELIITVGSPEDPGTRAQAEAAASAVEAVVAGGLEESGIYQLRWTSPQNLVARKSVLEAEAGVTSVSDSTIDAAGEAAVYPVAEEFEHEKWTWPYAQVNAVEAWDKTNGSNITVGIIDIGNVFAEHEDLNVAEIVGPQYVIKQHSTHVAGLACARNNTYETGGPQLGMVGMAWGCPIVSAAAHDLGTEVLQAMHEMAMRPNVEVVNLSLGNNLRGKDCWDSTEAAEVEKANNGSKGMFNSFFRSREGKRIVWVIAAGNHCAPIPDSPFGANFQLENVITVGATNSDNSLADFSNYGPSVKVAAPGGVKVSASNPNVAESNGLKSTVPGFLECPSFDSCPLEICPQHAWCSSYNQDMGTSMAAPIVAGIAALVRSYNPGLTADKAGECITASAGTGAAGDASTKSLMPKVFEYPDQQLPYSGSIPIADAAAAVECESQIPTEQATPMGPTSGPAGFGMQVSLASCTYLAVSFDGTLGYVQSSYSPSTTFDVVTTPNLTDGQHQMSFACESSVGGTVLWRSPGFSITITGGPIALGLQSTTVAPGEAIVYTSGPSESSTTCPPLPGVSLYGLSIYLDTPNGLAVAASRFITMPDDATTEALTVPPEAPAGAYTALEQCYYSGTNQLGIFEFSGPYSNVTVTGEASSSVRRADRSTGPRQTIDIGPGHTRTIPIPRNRVDIQTPPP